MLWKPLAVCRRSDLDLTHIEGYLPSGAKNFNFSLENKYHTFDFSPAFIPGLRGRHSLKFLYITLSLFLFVIVGLSGLFVSFFFLLPKKSKPTLPSNSYGER